MTTKTVMGKNITVDKKKIFIISPIHKAGGPIQVKNYDMTPTL